MNELEKRVQPDKRLFFIEIFVSISATIFIVLFSLLINYGHSISGNKILLITMGSIWLFSHILAIFVSIFFLFFKNDYLSSELKERAQFTYYWVIFAGFLFFVPFIVYRSYYLSGGKLETTKKAKKEYEISIIDKIYEKAVAEKNIKLNKENENRISDVNELYKDKFITFEEKNYYIWSLLKKETNVIKDYVDYNNVHVIKKVSDIIETY